MQVFIRMICGLRLCIIAKMEDFVQTFGHFWNGWRYFRAWQIDAPKIRAPKMSKRLDIFYTCSFCSISRADKPPKMARG